MGNNTKLADEAIYIGGRYFKALAHVKADTGDSLKTIIERALEQNTLFLKYFGKPVHTKLGGDSK